MVPLFWVRLMCAELHVSETSPGSTSSCKARPAEVHQPRLAANCVLDLLKLVSIPEERARMHTQGNYGNIGSEDLASISMPRSEGLGIANTCDRLEYLSSLDIHSIALKCS